MRRLGPVLSALLVMSIALVACAGSNADDITARGQTLLTDYWGALVASEDARALDLAVGPIRAQAEYRTVLHTANPATKLPPTTSVTVKVAGIRERLGGGRYLLDAQVDISLPELTIPIVYQDFIVEDVDGELKVVDYTDTSGDAIAPHCLLGDGVEPASAAGLSAELKAGIWSGGTQPSVGFALVIRGTGMAAMAPPGADATFSTAERLFTGAEPVFGVLSDGTEAYVTLDFKGAVFSDVADGGDLTVVVNGTPLKIAVPAFGEAGD